MVFPFLPWRIFTVFLKIIRADGERMKCSRNVDGSLNEKMQNRRVKKRMQRMILSGKKQEINPGKRLSKICGLCYTEPRVIFISV